MYTIISEVDREKGNYEDVFIYTLNAGFSGIAGSVTKAEIKMFIPDFLDIYLGDIESPIRDIREEVVVGGKDVIFDFGQLDDLGVSVRIGFGVVFKTTTPSLTTFDLTSSIYINDTLETEYTNTPITLEVIPRFEISREVVLPTIDPAPGSEVYFKVTLENFKDLGANINNVSIVCESLDELTIDPTFEISGKDVSSKFADTTSDGVLGQVVDNRVEFNLTSYKGEKYEFIYKAVIDDTLDIGTELVSTANWSVDSVVDVPDIHTITLGEEVRSAVIPVYAPDYTLQDEHIGYEFNIRNTGNQMLETVRLIETLPDDINYNRFETGIFHFSGINLAIDTEYQIEYTTVLGTTDTFGPFNTNTNSTVDLNFLLDAGDNIATLVWELPALRVGVESKVAPKIDGIVKSDVTLGSTILNDLELNYIVNSLPVTVRNTRSTLVQNVCVLNNSFNQNLKNVPINPGTTLNYQIGATCRESRLSNPIIAFMLPKELEYVGNETINYVDFFVDPETPILPPAVIIPNINANGDSIVKFEFKDAYAFTFRQKSNFNISFDTRVKIGATGTFETFTILNTLDASEIIPDESDIYRDLNDIAEDPNVSEEYAKSIVNSNRILFFVSTKSNKKVKGLLDIDYVEEPAVANTTAGGRIDYKITITNIGNVELEEIEIVDILPHLNDTAVLSSGILRDSDYGIYTIQEVSAKIIREDLTEEVSFDIYYSNSFDPVRFGPTFNVIGTVDDWTNVAPSDLVNIKAFKVKTKDVQILPNDILQIDVVAVAPVGTPTLSVAWNSFAANSVYKDLDGIATNLLAIEPEKVGITINDTPADKGVINGYAWFDTNKDGIPDASEIGLNDIGIMLLTEDGTIKDYTFTTPDFLGINGYYSFNNLDYGNYTLRFFKDPKYAFTMKNTDVENGSKVNPATSFTDEFTIDATTNVITANVGLVERAQIGIKKLLEVNESANQTMKNIIRNQMLITMKTEDAVELINMDKE